MVTRSRNIVSEKANVIIFCLISTFGLLRVIVATVICLIYYTYYRLLDLDFVFLRIRPIIRLSISIKMLKEIQNPKAFQYKIQ